MFKVFVRKVNVQIVTIKLFTIKVVIFEINNCIKDKFFLYKLREYSIIFSDKKIKALVESRISQNVKILSFDLLLIVIKDRKFLDKESLGL